MKQRELEEEARIEKFTAERLAKETQRKEREEARFKEKLETRQKMIDTQIEQLRALQDN